jgi:signal transduction histidine kinase
MTRADPARRGASTGASAPATSGEPARATLAARTINALIILAFIANLIYLGALLLPGAPATVLIDTWLATACQVLPVAVIWLVAVRTGFRRWEVNLVVAAITFNLAAETYYVAAMDSSGYLASPSPSDVGYLLFYPLMTAALFVLVLQKSRRVAGAVIVDSTLAALGVSAVLAVILVPIFDDAVGADLVESVIATMYPVFDMLLVAVVVGISASPTLRKGPRWQFLVLGMLLFTGADIVYALLVLNEAYVGGTPLDAAWSLGVAFVAVWVNGLDRPRSRPPADDSRLRILPVPSLAVLAGLGVLLLGTQTQVPPIALGLAAASVALSAVPVMFRQAALARMVAGQQRLVERLTALDKSKSDIIGTVSHEMRTPLTSILGFQELVLNDAAGPIPDEAKDMLRVANRNARRLESMVGNMLTMARLESGGVGAVVPVNIARVLNRSAESLRPFADSRKVDLMVVCEGSVVVEGDESQLERVFTNVMENAVKFSPADGMVHVDVSSCVPLRPEPSILISITDSGIGIPADEIPRLFDRFYRASNARENVVPGTGIGLSIVREIVEGHRGEIDVTSELGKGTTFRVVLPVRQPASQ